MDSGELLKLDRLQHDVLAPQIEAFLTATTDFAARESYVALKEAVDRLEVPHEMAARLGIVAEIALSSGHVRKAFGPGAELSLWSLFQKTPRGREITASVGAMNVALAQLAGQSLEHVTASLRGPGSYALTLTTAEYRMVLRFEPSGVRVESLEVGLG